MWPGPRMVTKVPNHSYHVGSGIAKAGGAHFYDKRGSLLTGRLAAGLCIP
jgi:hypothetical protein